MSKVVAVLNQKGGVGKTTTAVNLGVALAENSFKVLLIDLDPAGGLTNWLADGDALIDSGLDDLLRCEAAPHDILRRAEKLGVDFIAPGKNLRNVAVDGNLDSNTLRQRLNDFVDNYHFVLMDCPPSSGFLTASALMAADSIIIPIQTETLPLRAGIDFLDWLGEFRIRNETRIDIMGILPCMYDSRTRLSKRILDAMRSSENLGPLVFDTVIRKNATLAEFPGSGKSIFRSASTSFGASDYSSLVREVIERSGMSAPGGNAVSTEAEGDEKKSILRETDSAAMQTEEGEAVHQASGSSGFAASGDSEEV